MSLVVFYELFVTILKNAKADWTISSCSPKQECWNHPWCHVMYHFRNHIVTLAFLVYFRGYNPLQVGPFQVDHFRLAISGWAISGWGHFRLGHFRLSFGHFRLGPFQVGPFQVGNWPFQVEDVFSSGPFQVEVAISGWDHFRLDPFQVSKGHFRFIPFQVRPISGYNGPFQVGADLSKFEQTFGAKKE